jgi:hypothetical protein
MTAIRFEGSSLQMIPDILSDDGVLVDLPGVCSGSFIVLAGATLVSSDIRLSLVFFSPGMAVMGLPSAPLSIFGTARIVSPRSPRIGSRDRAGAEGLASPGGDDLDSADSEGAGEACLVVAGGWVAAGNDDSDTELISEGAGKTFRLDAGESTGAGGGDFNRKPN